MKKVLFGVVLLFQCFVLAEDSSNLQEITCKVKPIKRTKVHPQNSNNVSLKTVDSTNWCGYVAAPTLKIPVGGSVTDVEGAWIVPTILGNKDTTYCAIWVGIDGYLSSTVEQIGTSHNWSGGAQEDFAWFEMYPSGAFEILGFPIHRGDKISAKVEYIGKKTFRMILRNNTRGVQTTIPTRYTKSGKTGRTTADWIVEAPFEGTILPLSDFGVTGLFDCKATICRHVGSISKKGWAHNSIIMADGKVIKAIPSSLKQKGKKFYVTWEHE
jgi:hypothetical protein